MTYHKNRSVAQLVEQRSPKPSVECSSRFTPAKVPVSQWSWCISPFGDGGLQRSRNIYKIIDKE